MREERVQKIEKKKRHVPKNREEKKRRKKTIELNIKGKLRV